MPRQPLTSAREVASKLGIGDDARILQTAAIELLLAAADGRVDLNELAREELANRGLGRKGDWVGFEAAAKAWGRPS